MFFFNQGCGAGAGDVGDARFRSEPEPERNYFQRRSQSRSRVFFSKAPAPTFTAAPPFLYSDNCFHLVFGVIGGSLVVSRTRDRGVPGSNPSSGVVDCEK